MAKSVRSSVKKRNHANLRRTVFGPAADARTERLSAKLQELAAQPLKFQGPSKNTAEDNTTKAETEAEAEAEVQDESDKMVIDESAASQSKPSTKKRPDRVRKQSKRKPRNSIVFPKPLRKSRKN